MAIEPIGPTESGTNTRAKMNQAIAEANKVADKAEAADVAAVQAALVDTNAALDTTISEIALALGATERPGDARSFFMSSVSGAGRDAPPIAFGEPVQNDSGLVLRVPGSQEPLIVANRQDFALEPGQVYAGRWAVSRFQNTADPYGDAVEFRIAWLDKNKSYISTVLVDKRALTVADGRFVSEATFSRDQPAEFIAPAGARYVRLYVRILGGNGVTDIEVIRRWETNGLPGGQGAPGREPEYQLDVATEQIRWRQADGLWGAWLDIGSARKKAEAAATASATSAAQALRSEGNAFASASSADALKQQAELAAFTAGAPLFTSEPAIPGAPSPYLLQVSAGTQVYTHDGTTRTFIGWLGKIEFDSPAQLLAYPLPLGPVGTVLGAGGFRYRIASAAVTDEHLVTSGDVKLYVLPNDDGSYHVDAVAPAADGVTDDYGTIITKFINRLPVSTRDPTQPITARVVWGNSVYFMGQTISLKRSIHWIGSTGGLNARSSGTVLKFPKDTIGLYVNRGNTDGATNLSSFGQGADGSIFEGIALLGSYDANSPNDKHGVIIKARAEFKNCVATSFAGHGFAVLAAGSGATTDRGLANCFRFTTCGAHFNKRHGLYVLGSDANAGVVDQFNATNNGGFGILDYSFLGVLYTGCHSSSNATSMFGVYAFASYNGAFYQANPNATEAQYVTVEPGTNANVWLTATVNTARALAWTTGLTEGVYKTGGPYGSLGANPKTLFVNCYVESGQGRVIVAPRSLWIGGFSNYEVYGPNIMGYAGLVRTNGITSFAPSDGAGNVGIMASSGIPFNYAGADGISLLQLRDYGTYLGWNGGATHSAITTKNTTFPFGRSVPQPDKVVFPSIILGGIGSNGRHVTSAASVPASGEWAKGDAIFNISASASGKVGWVCTTGGTAGSTAVFKTFGAIDA